MKKSSANLYMKSIFWVRRFSSQTIKKLKKESVHPKMQSSRSIEKQYFTEDSHIKAQQNTIVH